MIFIIACTYSALLVVLQFFKPCKKTLLPLYALFAGTLFGHAKTMTSRTVVLILMWDFMHRKSRIEQLRIMIMHDGVVVAIHKKDWGAVGRHMMLKRKRILHGLGGKLAEQTTSRTLMGAGMSHGDNRIHGSHKPRALRRTSQLLGSMHHQMATSRKTHAPHPIRTDAILNGTGAHLAECTAQIVETCGELATTGANMEGKCPPTTMTIFQDKGCYAVLTQPLCNLLTFVLLVKPEITTTRADNDAGSRWITFGKISRQPVGLCTDLKKHQAEYD